MSSTREVVVPDIGDFEGVEVIEVLVAPGDRIRTEDPVITLESDKATMEIPSPAAGTVRELKVKVGDKVSQGSPILILEEEPEEARDEEPEAHARVATPEPAGAETPEPAEPAAPAAETGTRPAPPVEATPAAAATAPAPEPLAPETGKPHASPSVRRFARELGVDLAEVPGSGPKGRILADDVKRFVKGRVAAAPTAAALPAAPAVDFAKFGPVERRPLGRIRRLSAQHLHRSWMTIPHVTHFDEADVTELERFRRAEREAAGEVKLTLLAFVMKAAAAALARFPEVNASLAPDGEALVLKRYYHIGFAADTEQGLLVPVIREVDRKGVRDIAREITELTEKARCGKLAPADMQGGSFTVSSLGAIGGTQFTPIINAPEVAILGVSRAAMRPRWIDGRMVPRLMLPLALSYDHRVIDGAAAARFVTFLVSLLGDLRRLLL